MADQENGITRLPTNNVEGSNANDYSADAHRINNHNDEDEIDNDDVVSVLSYISSTGSTSSLDDSSDDDDQNNINTAPMSMLERQARNIERNQKFLGSLHEKYNQHLPPKTAAAPKSQKADEAENDTAEELPFQHFGILMKHLIGCFMHDMMMT